MWKLVPLFNFTYLSFSRSTYLVSLLSSESDLIVGPSFSQQTKAEESIPDLSIVQRPFSVFFETKLTNWFYVDQTFKHIAGINAQAQDKILFLLSNFDTDEPEAGFTEQIKRARHEYQVTLQPISFEEFVQTLEGVRSSEKYKKMLNEFTNYLDRSDLLPKWKYLLDVVNCAGSVNELDSNVYICPDTGGAYSHRRAKYLGSYAHKQVDKIFEIRAVVSIERNLGEGLIKWNNTGETEATLSDEARNIIRNFNNRLDENKSTPLQVFLLDRGEQTHFLKTTSGGMFSSKKYFWNIAIGHKNSKELAEFLDGRSWNEFKE